VSFLTLNQSPTTGMPGAPVTVSAALADVSLAPAARVTGATISFAAGGGSCVGTTDADGIARCELTPTEPPGTATLSASFAGSSTLTPSADSTAFVLLGAGGDGALTGVGPAHLWVGLTNSDDVGTQFDVRVQVRVGDALVAEGQTLCVTRLARSPNRAQEVVVPLELLASGDGATGDVLRVEVSTRIGTTPQGARCPGPGGSHANARGLRLYYDSAGAASSVGLQLSAGALAAFYLDSNGGVCTTRPSPAANAFSLDPVAPTAPKGKCRDSAPVNFASGNAWKVVGAWTLPLE
jgi:hypothetical protein